MKILVFGINSFTLCGSFNLICKDTSQFCPSHLNGHLIVDNLSLHNAFSANLCPIRLPSCKPYHCLAWVLHVFPWLFLTVVCQLHQSVNIVCRILWRHVCLLSNDDSIVALFLVPSRAFGFSACFNLEGRLILLLHVSKNHLSHICMGVLFHYWALECTGHYMDQCPDVNQLVNLLKYDCSRWSNVLL